MKSFLKALPIFSLLLLINAKIIVLHKSDGTSENYYTNDFKKIDFDLKNVGVKSPPRNHIPEGISLNRMNGDKIQFTLREKSTVNIRLYDSRGRFLKNIDRSMREPGIYEVSFNNRCFANGLYFIIADLNGKKFSRKMVITR